MILQVAREILKEKLSHAHAAPSREAYYGQLVESRVTGRLWLRLAEFLAPILITAVLILSWEADRRDRAQLATQLAAAQQTIAAAADRQKVRDAQLTQTLAQLSAERKSAITADQIVKALPQALGLPQPIALRTTGPNASVGARSLGLSREASASPVADAAAAPPSNQRDNLPNNPVPKSPSAGDAILPSADLKPLYDFALDCQACRAKLATAQNDLADEKTKSASLAKQRDAAIRAVKGGSALRRIARAAKWFLLGAAAGAIASKAVH